MTTAENTSKKVININSQYRIVSGSHAWVIEENEGGIWVMRHNYTSLESLLRNFVDLLARTSEGKGVLKLYEEMNELMIKVMTQQKELLLELADSSLHPVIRESNSKLTNGGT